MVNYYIFYLFGGITVLAKKRAFISFDYDHDLDLKNLLVGQSKHSDTPFDIADYSIKDVSYDWKEKARARMVRCDVAIIICGEYTHTASGVSVELKIAQELRLPYFLLSGRSGKNCSKPYAAYDSDLVYTWTWDNLKKLLNGQR